MALQMKALRSTETSINIYQSTRRNIAGLNLHQPRCENLKFRNVTLHDVSETTEGTDWHVHPWIAFARCVSITHDMCLAVGL